MDAVWVGRTEKLVSFKAARLFMVSPCGMQCGLV